MIEFLCKVGDSQRGPLCGIDLHSRVRLWETNMKGKKETSLCSARTHMLSHMAGTQRFVESLRMVYIVKPSAFWEIGGRFGFGALQVH